MPALARIEPTQQQLRDAWTRLHRSTWPATFEEAMADPLLGRLVRMTALHPPPAVRQVTGAAAGLPLAVLAQVREPRPPQPGFVDMKRAAAGDRDD